MGGKEALLPLIQEFPNFYSKHDLAFPGELEPFSKKASLMAAIDYIVSEKSDVFMPSHGGNMGHMLQVYLSITPLQLRNSFHNIKMFCANELLYIMLIRI